MDIQSSEPFDFEAFQRRLESQILPRESTRAFAIRAGVSDTVMRKYLNKESEPSLRMTARIAKNLGIDLNWLAYGEGEQRAVHREEQAVNEAASALHLIQSDYTFIDSYQVFASAGHGIFVADEQKSDPMAFRTDWLKREGLSADRLAVIRAKGDSMEPTISDNDIILVHLCNGDTLRDGLYVLRIGDSLLVKRLQFDPFGGLKIISDNPGYETHQVSKEQRADVTIVGRVAWAGKKF